MFLCIVLDYVVINNSKQLLQFNQQKNICKFNSAATCDFELSEVGIKRKGPVIKKDHNIVFNNLFYST